METKKLEVIYSVAGITKCHMRAAHALQYENGDQRFPGEVQLVFYTDDKLISAKLYAKEASYKASEELYEFLGGVVVERYDDEETRLTTEALYWNRSQEELHTTQLIEICQGDKLLRGKGLRAKQDLSQYSIPEPCGSFQIQR